jgi:Bacteriophage related domain of unknown function
VNYHAIRTLLDTQLQTAAGLPTLQTENTNVTIVDRSPWCRASLLPAEPTDLNVGPVGKVAHRGLYQVDLFYAKGATAADANTMATAVTTALPRGYMQAVSGGVLHVEMSWQQTAYSLEGWYVVPVVVRWVVYA